MRHHILIVDDDPKSRNLLREVFSREPYDLFTAASGEQALEILAREKIDVVITDERMPGMPGSEFIALVRKTHPDTIRIILTGHADVTTAIRAINEGEIFRFFTKPCNIVDLATTIRHAIQLKDLTEENRRLLKLVKKQFALIDEMERKYPGITKVKRNVYGEVIFDDDLEDGGLEMLLQKIQDAKDSRHDSTE